MAIAAAGCGNASRPTAPAPLAPADSSWVSGQPGLWTLHGFAAILRRADSLGALRAAARRRELAEIAADKRAARQRARRDALRKYLEAKRRAERLYKLALEKAAEARKRQEEKLRKARLERARKLRELMRKLRVKPGQECSLPEVRAQFHCVAGRLPLKRSLK
ncbi:MAG: hypothetical protein ACJ76Z_03325 [Thermoleophilaceae bacterium]